MKQTLKYGKARCARYGTDSAWSMEWHASRAGFTPSLATNRAGVRLVGKR